MTRRAPEWTDDDRDVVRAWLLNESLKCPGCGGDITETTDPENEGRYVAEAPHRCFRCTAIHRKQKAYEESPEPRALVLWPAELRKR